MTTLTSSVTPRYVCSYFEGGLQEIRWLTSPAHWFLSFPPKS